MISPARPRRRALALALAATITAIGAGNAAATGVSQGALDQALPSGTAQGEQSLYLDVMIDGHLARPLVPFTLRDGRLGVAPSELAAAGLNLPADLAVDDDGLVWVDSIPGLSAAYEPAMQRLNLHPVRSLRTVRQLGYSAPGARDVRRDHGLVFDYDAYARSLGDSQTLSVGTGLRWFGRFGSVELTGVSRAGDGGDDAYERLDSRWTYSDPQRMWTWTVGDLVSGGLAWTRPVRLGGVQWRRNFGVRPDLIVYPMPQFAADATVPSSVELYVNNVRQYSGEVDPGPFVLNDFPRVIGAGQAVVVVTDALGRSTQTSVPLYVDYQRLARGLSDFSLEAGLLRSGFGIDSGDYGNDPVASGSWRRGMTDEFTVEVHGEAGPDLHTGGVGLAWSPLGRFGVISGSYARSSGLGSGDQQALGYQWFGRSTGLDLYSQRASRGFRDLGSLDGGSAPLSSQDRASLWFGIPRGSFSMTWLRYRDLEDVPSRTVSIGLNQTIGRSLSLSASAFEDDRAGHGVSLSLSMPLGRELDASVSYDHSRGQSDYAAGVRRSVPYAGGWGWEAQARDSGDGQVSAAWRGRAAEAWFGMDRVDDDTGAFAQGNGSVVVMGGQAFASRRITDSFAVVSTNGVADVPILYENRVAGRTNRDGYLLLPELRGWQSNRIAIDPDGLGANLEVPAIERMVTPADHGGVRVNYELVAMRTASVALSDGSGKPVAAGTRVHRADGSVVIVGYDGALWLEHYVDGETLRWTRAGTACATNLPPLASVESSPQLGPAECTKEESQ
ncbi:fimbria/pilus outer membrane usher protein [Lysobacter niastensis]|uniref:Fimbrial biogenesis outer membrane usher protein n=1 Tax=Lysobacter niastensis TaxID=380629 RepID=A0ABS0B455_9GAMM|nr:fimbria/pilus outer membrane usher protein [Lysobacter niastensis]MBF6023330.1 fimbrial biogenesis outer membrane usher protein [Lysobacter niastensis]